MASMTSSAAMATATSSHGGMDMGGGNCKISMLFNLYTVDACFLTEQWHVTGAGTMAVSCIGVAALVVLLELLRRLGKEYDSFIVRAYRRHIELRASTLKLDGQAVPPFRATPLQQLTRSFIHAITFGVAYVIMLLAMYFNGYIIASIVIGALLGKFFCDWLVVEIQLGGRAESSALLQEEPTMCCG